MVGLCGLGASILGGCHLVLGFEETSASTSAGAMGGAGGSGDAGGGSHPGGARGEAGSMGGANGSGGREGCVDVLESEFSASTEDGVSDDFTDKAATLNRWSAKFLTENEGGFNQTACRLLFCNGALNLYVGKPTSGVLGYFWHVDQSGPLIYQRVTGDFAIELEVKSVHLGLTKKDEDFSTGAGLIVRNPNSVSHWSQYRLGLSTRSQGRGTRHRWRNGVANATAQTSFTPATSRSGKLLICRIAGSFSHHRLLDGDSSVVTESPLSVPDLEMGAEDTLEVGMSAVWYHGLGPGSVAIYENVTFHAPPVTHLACADLL